MIFIFTDFISFIMKTLSCEIVGEANIVANAIQRNFDRAYIKRNCMYHLLTIAYAVIDLLEGSYIYNTYRYYEPNSCIIRWNNKEYVISFDKETEPVYQKKGNTYYLIKEFAILKIRKRSV